MDSARRSSADGPAAEALEFVRFCYQRRRLGWPELYDEMCTVAGRGIFKGWGVDDLAAVGVGFSLFDTPALAAMAARIVAEENDGGREQGRAAKLRPGSGALSAVAILDASDERESQSRHPQEMGRTPDVNPSPAEAFSPLILAGGAT